MSHVLSVKLSDEEWDALRSHADERNLYPHGVVKLALRKTLGLYIPERLRERVEVVPTR